MDGINCTRQYEDPAELMRRHPISQSLTMADLRRRQAEAKQVERRQPKGQGLRRVWSSSDDTSSDGELKDRQDVPLGKAKQVKKSRVGRDSDARSGA